MKYRSELTIDGYTVLNIHETPTHDIETPVLPEGCKHPAGLTCGDCGAQFNTGSARGAHWHNLHSNPPWVFSNWGEFGEIK